MPNAPNVVDIDVDMSVEDSVHSFLLYRKGKEFVCDNTNLQDIFPSIFYRNKIAKNRLVKLLAYFECQCFKQDFSKKIIDRLSELLKKNEIIAIALIKINDTYGSAVLEHIDRNDEGKKQFWIHEVCKSGISNRTKEGEIEAAKQRKCPYPEQYTISNKSPIPFIFEMFKNFIIQVGGDSSWLYVDKHQSSEAVEALVGVYSKKYNYEVQPSFLDGYIAMKTSYLNNEFNEQKEIVEMADGKKKHKKTRQHKKKKHKKTHQHKKTRQHKKHFNTKKNTSIQKKEKTQKRKIFHQKIKYN